MNYSREYFSFSFKACRRDFQSLQHTRDFQSLQHTMYHCVQIFDNYFHTAAISFLNNEEFNFCTVTESSNYTKIHLIVYQIKVKKLQLSQMDDQMIHIKLVVLKDNILPYPYKNVLRIQNRIKPMLWRKRAKLRMRNMKFTLLPRVQSIHKGKYHP